MAQQHALDIGQRGIISHKSSISKAGVKDRMKLFGTVIGSYGENISFSQRGPEETVAQLIVDDGSKSKGNRTNFFKKESRIMGCYTSEHREYQTCTVINYAGGLGSNDSDPF
mmetsp:Transcript_24640/g.38302  ORF Transcript_24640/g.38302 Transcript_24640/m.38302 type:complete len:112 (+) Transcript_24640:247-582(+)|eukprot:CAMPEP_0170496482 /NCGR_PEP_ID=MMETSP0208-20121228/21743_1 /TAXON_ID=197538 /ORGANISM="Strombidium inclinatum, Strain S3" /LENGTH=111 /DNA_ID=CAMNT_0010773037 /DNA_START=170 /DNA_END=505 /DNA_ORIENTATION=-